MVVLIVTLAFQGMSWGHAHNCGCGLCTCFPRVFALVALGTPSPGWVPWASDRLRILEADLRDELGRRGAPASLTQANEPRPAPKAATGETGGDATTSSPKKAEPEPAGATAKGKPCEPPKELHPDRPEEVKKEAPAELEERPPAEPEGRPPAEPASSSRGHRRSRSKRSRGRKASRRSRSRRSRSRRRSRRASSRERGGARSPRDCHRDRRERKSHPERPPEPEGPPPDRSYSARPPEPQYPPRYPPRGRGWVGPVPRSDHPRWTQSENKGVVKRAKQERFNQRKRRDRRR